MPKPVALLFDVNGTLFPADSAASAFRELGLPSSAVEVGCDSCSWRESSRHGWAIKTAAVAAPGPLSLYPATQVRHLPPC